MGISTWSSSSEALRMQAVSWLVNWGLGAVGPRGDVASSIAPSAHSSRFLVDVILAACAALKRGEDLTLGVLSLLLSTNSDLRGPRVNSLSVDFRHRAHVVFRVLPHPLVVDLGDHCGYGQRILEIPP
jgi:hypothetical protein